MCPTGSISFPVTDWNRGRIPRMLLILFSVSLCFSWVSPDTNSLTVMYTAISGIRDFPEVINVAMVKGVQLNYHDTDIRRMIPRQQFMEDAFDAKYWEYLTGVGNSRSTITKDNLNTIMKGTNQTSGVHIFQWISVVEITDDGSIKRSIRFGYDGKDYISLEPDRMRWVASNHHAVKTMEKWNSDESWNKYWKTHLEEGFVKHLHLYLRAGKEYFERKVQPKVFISRTDPNSQYKPPTLSCLVTGFHPVDIEVTWLRNGEPMSEIHSSGIRPNHDGTHQIKKEIEVNAGDEEQYSCYIEHSSLAEAKVYRWEILEKSRARSHPGIIIGTVATLVIIGIIGIVIWIKQRRDNLKRYPAGYRNVGTIQAAAVHYLPTASLEHDTGNGCDQITDDGRSDDVADSSTRCLATPQELDSQKATTETLKDQQVTSTKEENTADGEGIN